MEKLCLALALHLLLLSLGHLPARGAHSQNTAVLSCLSSFWLMCILQKKNKGRVRLCIGFNFLPAPWQHLLEKKWFAAKRFAVKAFCIPRRKLLAQQGDLVKTVIWEGTWPRAPG